MTTLSTPNLQVGLTSAEVQKSLAAAGPNSLADKEKSAMSQFLSFFWGPIPWMIMAAAAMALLVKDYGDFTIITALLFFNAILGFWQEHQASNALKVLKSSLALKARVLRDGKWLDVNASTIVPGDIIRLYIGDVVPADCKLVQGDYISIDQSALTGESLPATKKVGDVTYSGSVVKQGEMIAQVTATGNNTYFGRTAKLVASAGNKSHFQKAVLRIGNFLVLFALFLGVILIVEQLSSMRGDYDHVALMKLAELVLVLLIASVPVAMPAVLSVTMALGARKLVAKKAIVSRLEAIEELAGINILCSDKTGTLTQNKLTLGEPQPWAGADAKTLVLTAALASRASDNDPIDEAILAYFKDPSVLKPYSQGKYTAFNPVSKRTECVVTSEGKTFNATKGAPQVILALAKLAFADVAKAQAVIDKFASQGYRTLGVARGEADGTWTFLGILPLFDPPRVDSKETIARALEFGVKVKMVTGDNVAIAKQISGQLGLGENILPATSVFGSNTQSDLKAIGERIGVVDGFAEVFPEHKYAIVKALQESGNIVGMTGDGVNDAPALKQADVGIAVSGATEAARAAAALILTAPGLSVIIDGIAEARRIFERMTSYILYRIAMTLNIMIFVVLASIFYGFFPLSAIMIIALALLDDVPIMLIAFDNAEVTKTPVRWQMDRILTASSILGLISVVQSFVLLYLGESYFHLDKPHLQTMMFLQLVAGGHLLLFLTRKHSWFWLPPFPNSRLVLAIIATQIAAVLMSGFGVLVPALSWSMIGVVWLYNFAWMFVMDAIKVGFTKMFEHRKEAL